MLEKKNPVLFNRKGWRQHNYNFFIIFTSDVDFVCQETGEKMTLFEVGCGVGNFMFPLLGKLPNIFIYACDFSKRAVEFVQVCFL